MTKHENFSFPFCLRGVSMVGTFRGLITLNVPTIGGPVEHFSRLVWTICIHPSQNFPIPNPMYQIQGIHGSDVSDTWVHRSQKMEKYFSTSMTKHEKISFPFCPLFPSMVGTFRGLKTINVPTIGGNVEHFSRLVRTICIHPSQKFLIPNPDPCIRYMGLHGSDVSDTSLPKDGKLFFQPR